MKLATVASSCSLKIFSGLILAGGLALSGCSSGEAANGNTPTDNQTLSNRAQTGLDRFTSVDASLKQVTDNAYAYAVLPEVGEAALGVGGAGGRGVVYRNGQPIGTVTLNLVSVGPQIGGQSYSELVVFQNQSAFDRLQQGGITFGAEASATIVKAGAAAADRFTKGVAVYILPRGGFEAGASLNGQKLMFQQNQNISQPSGSNNGNPTTQPY
ncbi:MAG TPA: YSC84-related protein [Tepidisphaeraceae bacterium]|nr:YSC84-related protein [Tepidisphaeraceae bacterium]